jgi:hypothetical protein
MLVGVLLKLLPVQNTSFTGFNILLSLLVVVVFFTAGLNKTPSPFVFRTSGLGVV